MFFSDRNWQNARWISAGFPHYPWDAPSRPLPFFRRCFDMPAGFKQASVHVCAPGWMEFRMNGELVSEDILTPSPSQFPSVVHYVTYDVTAFLQEGKNTIGIVLGNGWYCCGTKTAWNFDLATWKDYPKLLLDLVVDGKSILVSDDSWLCLKENGPWRFSELRNGDFYDARLECPGWSTNDFDATGWEQAEIANAPGGKLLEQVMPPCRVIATFPCTLYHVPHVGGVVYSIPQNISGWVNIKVVGETGAQVKLIYGERIDTRTPGLVDRNNDLMRCIHSGEFQTDCYILKGGGQPETWHPQFTYHGFCYIRVEITGQAKLLEITASAISTNFEKLADFESSDPVLNRLYANNYWSFVNNFTGIPTDCPTREKNSWVGDAMLSAESGLCLFEMKQSYRQWFRSLRGVQWPNGIMPGLGLNPGWGFTWGTGSGDYVFLYISWQVYCYTGDALLMEENWDSMERIMEYLDTLTSHGLINHGLGEWFNVDPLNLMDKVLCASMEYVGACGIMTKICRLLGKEDRYTARAKVVRQAILDKWYKGNGHMDDDCMSTLSGALFFDICPEEDRSACAALLNRKVVENHYKPAFGVLGARMIFRVLCDCGYPESAYRMLMQPAYPGFVDMINRGATTLWEDWLGDYSRNHVMFGDLIAWMFAYLAGIKCSDAAPGFSRLTIQPFCPEELDFLNVRRKLSSGEVKVSWKKVGDGAHELTITKNAAVPCDVILPDGRRFSQNTETATYHF